MFHVIQLAITTLSDPILKLKYDDLLKADLMRQARFNDMDQARKKGKLDLEERERQAQENSKRFKSSSGHPLSKKEVEALEKEKIREQGASKILAMMQQKKQDHAKSLWIANQLQSGPELLKNASVLDCTCRVKWSKDAGLVDETRLCNYYSKFGLIDKIIIKQGKKSATVVFKDVTGSFNAMHLYSATSTHSIPPDPAFTTKLLSKEPPPAFTFLSLKRDPTSIPVSSSTGTTSTPTTHSTAYASTAKGGSGAEAYEKQTLDRLKEKERMRKELLENQDDA